MNRSISIAVVLCFCSTAIGQSPVDGLTIWSTDWDRYDAQTGYNVVQWSYDGTSDDWTGVEQPFVAPLIQNEVYTGDVFDMDMDMIWLEGSSELSGIFVVSKGTKHFPSTGTEFQHRKLNAQGEWVAAQAPLFTLPAAVSPLGVDIYREGNGYKLVWLEDNDGGGPNPNLGEIFVQDLSLVGGELQLVGDAQKIHSQQLNWSATYPGPGGLTGVTAGDWDSDGDVDVFLNEMFLAGPSDGHQRTVEVIEQTAPGVYSSTPVEVLLNMPRTGADGLHAGNIDNDEKLDFISAELDFREIMWYELQSDGSLLEQGRLFDAEQLANDKALFDLLPVEHIFGLFAAVPSNNGDYNGDGNTDSADYVAWLASLGAHVPPGFGADGNRDGVIDLLDYAHWKSNLGTTAGALQESPANVPEPTGLMLALAGLALAYSARWRAESHC